MQDVFPWPEESGADSLQRFTSALAEALETQGYCSIKVPTDDKARQSLEQLAQDSVLWNRPKPTYAHTYLGVDEDSVLLRIDDLLEQEADKYDKDWYFCVQPVVNACGLLQHVAQSSLGFGSTGEPAQMMLRKRSPGLLRKRSPDDDAQAFARSIEHLDFLKRRKCCLMSFIKADIAGTVTLTPVQKISDRKIVEVPVETGILLIFRHDQHNYEYKPVSNEDLVLQAWLLEAARDVILPAVQGKREDILEFLGARGTKMTSSDEPHIMSTSGHYLTTFGEDQMFQLFESGCDGVIEVPIIRWSNEIYYSPDPMDGLSISKHVGFIDVYLMDIFDNEYWSIDPDHAGAVARDKLKGLEAVYETLCRGGFTRATMRDAPISLGAGCMQAAVSGADESGAMGFSTTNYCPLPNFVSFYLGIAGQCFMVDTACSSSIVATHILSRDMIIGRDGDTHTKMNRGHIPYKDAVLLGCNTFVSPFALVGLGGAHMMGMTGRSTSWDASANGFGLADAICAVYFCAQNDLQSQTESNQLAGIIGSTANQDGRSASLTAPNGPAQTACLREALRNSGARPDEVTFNECHATGTKLGDVIEMGSTMVCFKSDTRVAPLGHGAFKTFSGHPTVAAGAVAIIKNVMSMKYSKMPTNLHLYDLNPNMDMKGYAHLVQNETVDTGMSFTCFGVTGMGYGGTNARVDLAGTCSKGFRSAPRTAMFPSGAPSSLSAVALLNQADAHQKKRIQSSDVPYVLVVCPECSGDMCFRCCQAFVTQDDYAQEHQCSLVREPSAAYDCCSMCYKGFYIEGVPRFSGEVGNAGYSISTVGSWSGWSKFQPMHQTMDEHGDIYYTQIVSLDDKGQAEFRLVLEENRDMNLYPIVEKAGRKARISGPDSGHKSRSWLIDGSVDGMSAGTKYNIKFTWNYQGKALDWYPEM